MSEPEQAPEGRPPKSSRIMWSFIKPHKKALFLGVVLGIGSAGAGLALPMSIKNVLESLGTGQSIMSTLWPTLIFVGAATVLGIGQGIVLGRLGERVVLTARRKMVNRLLRAKTTTLSQHPGGELVARVTSDSSLLRRATADSLVGLTKAGVMLVGSIVLMAVLSWTLLLVTMGGILLIFVLVGFMMPSLAKAGERAQDAVGHLGGTLDSVLRAVKTVKASRSEKRETARAVVDAEIAAKQGIRASVIQTLSSVLAGTGSQLAIMIVLAIGAYQISQHEITVATMVAFLLYALQLVDPIRNTIDSLSELQSGVAAAARINEIEQFEIEMDPPGAMVVPPSNSPVVAEFLDVSAAYAPTAPPVVQNLNLRIPRTGHTAIVGPSGAGKTTVFTMLLRFLDINGGEIRVDGAPLTQWSLDQLRSKIVYVEQETPLLPGSLRYNVSYFRQEATDADIWQALRSVCLDTKFDNIENALDSDLASTTMSGGERQRVALARALCAKPEILLLDEATSALDGITESVVADCIAGVAGQGAVVTIAHRLSTVIDANQIIVMEAGRVRAAGTHQELMDRDELYRDLIAALKIGPNEAQPAHEVQEERYIPVDDYYSRPSRPLLPSLSFNFGASRRSQMSRTSSARVSAPSRMLIPNPASRPQPGTTTRPPAMSGVSNPGSGYGTGPMGGGAGTAGSGYGPGPLGGAPTEYGRQSNYVEPQPHPSQPRQPHPSQPPRPPQQPDQGRTPYPEPPTRTVVNPPPSKRY
jgi:ABC-type multidrug transport system fused ATPase/permease subunit